MRRLNKYTITRASGSRRIAMRVWRLVRWLAAGLALVVVVLLLAAYLYARKSLPQTSGAIEMRGLSAAVDIVRDRDAVPHIYSRSRADGLFALGFVHAQDRLWQMEFQRRAGQGRLSEILGDSTLQTDEYMRTLGLYDAANQAWRRLPANSRSLIEAYVSGVNAFLSTHSGSQLPPEFSILSVRPERWRPEDVLVLAKLMAFNLGGNFAAEMLRSDLTRAVGAQRAAQLLPDSPASDLTIISGHAAGLAARVRPSMSGVTPVRTHATLARIAEPLPALPAGIGIERGLGSNAWAVDGTRTKTGKPILANDPHLGAQLPSTWYLAHLSADDLDVIGATVPGLPGVVIGRNLNIAWGVTNLYPDTEDLFREHLDSTGQLVEFQGHMEAVQKRIEVIPIKGRPSLTYTVRLTRHGPLISDVEAGSATASRGGPRDALALRWTALDPDDYSVAALLQLNSASNWDQFRTAFRGYVAPALGYVYADVGGNIGFFGAGRIPVRRSGDGLTPAEGWSGANEWVGYVPFEAAPQVYNPPEHAIIAANNRPVPIDSRYFLGATWEKPYRAVRIAQLLQAHGRVGLQETMAMQADTVSLEARELTPALLRLTTPLNEEERWALKLLRDWNADMQASSPAAAIFAAWTRRLPDALIADKLGRDLAARYEGWSDLFVSRFLANTLQDPNNPWCDVVATPKHEDCAAAAHTALVAALRDIHAKLGSDRTAWRWDRLHAAVFSHQPFGYVPFLRPIFNRSIANGGGNATVDLGEFDPDLSFTQSVVPGYRQVIDLANRDNGRFIIAIGQSGHALSPHYDDYLEDWRRVRYRQMRFVTAAELRDHASFLRLEPGK